MARNFSSHDKSRIARAVIDSETRRDGQQVALGGPIPIAETTPIYLMKRVSSGNDWTKGTSQDCNYYAGAKGTETTTGEGPIPVFNRMGDVPAGDLWLFCFPIGDGLELQQVECDL